MPNETEANLLENPFNTDSEGYNINIFKNEDNSLEFTIKKNNDIYYLKYKEKDILDYFSHHNFDLFEPDFQRYLNNRQFQITKEGEKLIIKLNNENFKNKEITLEKLNNFFFFSQINDLKKLFKTKITKKSHINCSFIYNYFF